MLETSSEKSISRWGLNIYLRFWKFSKRDLRFSMIDISSSMLMRWRRENLRFDVENLEIMRNLRWRYRMHAKIWTSQMLYLYCVFTRGSFPSSEEEKRVDDKLPRTHASTIWVGMAANEHEKFKREDRRRRNASVQRTRKTTTTTERKHLQVYLKDNRKVSTAPLMKRFSVLFQWTRQTDNRTAHSSGT